MSRLTSLRHRVLLLFAVLAIVPLVTLGLVDYLRARSVVERILIAQTRAGAVRAARILGDRAAMLQTDALLFGDNAEMRTLLRVLGSSDTADVRAAAAKADTFAHTIWETAAASYRAIELRSATDSLLIGLTTDSVRSAVRHDEEMAPFVYPVGGNNSQALGRVLLYPRTAMLVPAQLRALAFGRAGYLVVADLGSGQVLLDTRHHSGIPAYSRTAVTELIEQSRSSVREIPQRYGENDTARIASIERVQDSQWVVLSSAALPEFTADLGNTGLRDLLLVLGAAGMIGIAFTILIGRTTRSLEELTTAAKRVASGDLSPALPRTSDDEVGTLALAFEAMLTRLQSMVREIEVSRQLAVLGEFSAQLSHEIRNPLTSIKLNLQALSRDVERGGIAQTARVPIDICLREVRRLDGVVRGVLSLSRPSISQQQLIDLHELLRRVCAVHELQMDAAGIVLTIKLDAARFSVGGDENALVSLFTNLIVNAIEAQSVGGAILVATSSGSDAESIEVTIADQGAGIPAALMDRVFRPFVSGKSTGTGLGLSLALNIARDHRGNLELVKSPEGFVGAAFRIVLPLSAL